MCASFQVSRARPFVASAAATAPLQLLGFCCCCAVPIALPHAAIWLAGGGGQAAAAASDDKTLLPPSLPRCPGRLCSFPLLHQTLLGLLSTADDAQAPACAAHGGDGFAGAPPALSHCPTHLLDGSSFSPSTVLARRLGHHATLGTRPSDGGRRGPQGLGNSAGHHPNNEVGNERGVQSRIAKHYRGLEACWAHAEPSPFGGQNAAHRLNWERTLSDDPCVPPSPARESSAPAHDVVRLAAAAWQLPGQQAASIACWAATGETGRGAGAASQCSGHLRQEVGGLP